MWLLDALKQKNNSDDIAVILRDKRVSYKTLWSQSENIAAWMRQNLSTKNPVVIYGNKDTEILAIMHAALKTGRAYVPVDVTYPVDRLAKIAIVTETEVVYNFTDIDISSHLSSNIKLINKTELLRIADTTADRESCETEWVQGDDNCYILFTSGSTGEPKGVQISKNNLLNFVEWFEPYCTLKSGKVALNQVSYSFDVSVIPLYIYLSEGVTIYTIDKVMTEDFAYLFNYLKDSGLAAWISTPAFIEMCVLDDKFDRTLMPNFEKVILAGEVLTKRLVKELWQRFSGVTVINGYGPTEGTVLLTACVVTKNMVDDDKNAIPIGKILDNAEYWIKDNKAKNVTTENEKGELIVVSKSISKGYYKNPEITEKSFFTTDEGIQGYRTGDVVYRIGDLLYFCGRKDFQIKLNGYRIELDDIAENLNKLDCVNNNVVLPVMKDGKVSYLIAFVVPAYELKMPSLKAATHIKNELKELIPSYMIPKRIVLLEDFPLNTNGKIDRKKLLELYVK